MEVARVWEDEYVLLVEPHFCEGIQWDRANEGISVASGALPCLVMCDKLFEVFAGTEEEWCFWSHKEYY